MLALPDSIWLLPLFAALAAAGLAIWILIRPWSEVFHRRLTLVLALTALVELSHAAPSSSARRGSRSSSCAWGRSS